MNAISPAPHAWFIDPLEYERHEHRRGRRFAFPELDVHRTALIVIDMVPLHVVDNPFCQGIVSNVNRLATRLRSVGGVVVWVVPAVSAPSARMIEFFGAATAEAYGSSGGVGTYRDRLWRELAIDDSDLFVEKSAYSAFFPGRSELPRLLEERGVDTVLITGTVTNVCCESSARDAETLGFRVIMVADANAARRDSEHNATLHTVYRTFGDVRTTSDLVEMIGT